MAFPTSPTNGQVTVVNQVSYQYSSATNSWTRILSTANVITANTIAVNGALTVGTTISATGNITGSYFFGNGSQLTGVAAASAGFPVSAGTSNIAAAANSNIAITVGGTANVAVFATTGEYITGVLSANGTVTGGNLVTGGFVTATGNVQGGNLLTGGLISATSTVTGSTLIGTVVTASGNITGGNVLTGGLISATSTITSAANITGGNILTGGLVSATADITGGNLLTGGLVSATANVTGGNLLTGGLISATSTITSAANITGGNILTAGLVSATGNATFGNISTTGASGNISGANVISGTTLSATANVIGGNVTTGGLITATGNITGGNVLTAGLVSATGNVTGNYILGNGAFLSGVITSVANINNGTSNVNIASANANVTVSVDGTSNVAVFATTGEYVTGIISASGNIISAANVSGGNILTGGLVSATANVTGGNLLTGGLASVTGNVIAGNVNTGAIQPTSGALTISTATGDINLNPAGNIVLASGNSYINNLAQPVQNQDAATKLYVDNLASTAITYHEAVYVATTANLETTTSGAITYAQPNGAANGIGATLTTTTSFNLIDTANVQNVGTRILVKDQANAVQNGVYTWANATVIVRSTDTDQYGAESTESFSINDYFFTSNGNVNAGTAFIVSAPAGTITFGTSNISFAIFSQSQVYSANTAAGLSLTGTVFSAKVDNTTTAFDGGGNIIVKASANLTTPNIGAATGTSLSLTGNIDPGNVNTGGLVSATGNVTGGNVLTGGLISATSTITSAANITGGNLLTGGLVSATANVTGGNLLTGGLISATSTITSAANITGGNILTAGLVSATGNVTGNYILGNGAFLSGVITSVANINNGTSNVTVVSSGGNITVGVGGTGNVAVFATTGEYITGLLSVSGNITSAANVSGGNLLTGGLISATANITGGNVLTGGLISSTGNVTGGNLITVGLISTSGNIAAGNILSNNYFYANGTPVPPGIIYTANTAPPTSPAPKVTDQWYNTSTDVLYQYLDDGTTDYWVDISSPAFAAGVVANVAISGSLLVNANATYDIGSSSQSFANVYAVNYYGNGASLSGIITSVSNINNGTTNMTVVSSGGNIAASVGGTSNVMVISSGLVAITGDLSVSGNATLSGNILGDRIQNGTTQIDIQSPNGNANVTIAGTSNVAVFATSGVFITGVATANGNVTGGNIITGGLITATGNVAGNYFIGNGSALTGIDATSIQSGTSNVRVVSSGGNVAVGISNTSNVAVFATTGVFITGVNSVSGNVTGGNLTTAGILTVNSGAAATAIENGASNAVGNIGSASTYFNRLFAQATTALYADLAENYLGDADYASGTVLDFGGTQEVTISTVDSSKRVAGVVSTNPAHLMNAGVVGEHVVTVALIGRVPVSVTGTVRKGDLMVSAGDGTAKAVTIASPKVGTIIGKSLEDFDGDKGTIEIVIGKH